MTPALVRVGALTLVVVLLAVFVALYMGGLWARVGTYQLFLRLPNAGGVDSGADVMMSGVRIGVVVSVKLQPDETNWPNRPVRMVLAIRNRYQVPAHYEIGIDQGGLLANRYIGIEPPRLAKGEKPPVREGKEQIYLPHDAEVAGKGLRGLAAAGQMADDLGQAVPMLTQQLQDRLDHLADRVEATYMSTEHERLVHEILVNMSQMTATANRAALNVQRIAVTIERASGTASPDAVAMVKELRIAATNVRETAEQINRLVAVTPLPTDMAAAGANIREATAAMAESAAAIRDIASSDETQLRFRELTANLARVSAALAGLSEETESFVSDQQLQGDIKQAVQDMRATMSSLRTSVTHLEGILTDKEMTEDLQTTVHNLRVLTDDGREVAAKASRSLDRVDHTMDSLSSAVHSIKPRHTRGFVDARGIYDQGARVDLDLDLFYGSRRPGFWRLGIFDVGDSERFTLQRGIGLRGPWTFRAGVFANKPSVGLDWASGSGWRAELDLYDPEETLVDFTLFRSLSDDWRLGIGVSDVFDRVDPFIGLRRSFGFSGPPPSD